MIVLCLIYSSAKAQCNGCAFFSYPDTFLCASSNPMFTDSIATPGGVFATNAPGVLIDPVTGTLFTTGNTQAGSFTVTYTSPSSCGQVCTVNIEVFACCQSEFFYPSPVLCIDSDSSLIQAITASPLSASDTFYASPPGLGLDPLTGSIDLNNSVAGVYAVTHERRVPCSGLLITEVTISQADTGAYLDYPQEVYCPNDSLAIPLLVTDSAGYYPAQRGMNLS